MKIESNYNNLYGRFNGKKTVAAIEFKKNGWNNWNKRMRWTPSVGQFFDENKVVDKLLGWVDFSLVL